MLRSYVIQITAVLALTLSISVPAGFLLVETVTNTDDTGPGSLRAAILNANSQPSDSTEIRFNIPGDGPFIIQPLTPLPTITVTVFILGNTQPGTTNVPLVEIDGTNLNGFDAGLIISSGSSLVRGLTIGNFPIAGLVLEDSSRVTVEGCHLGTNTDGTQAKPNGVGLLIIDSSVCQIGGSGVGDGNLISGNDVYGILISGVLSQSNTIQGNLIGTDGSGGAALRNGEWGILCNEGADGTLIGGAQTGAGNVISANGFFDGDADLGGIYLEGSSHTVQGNLIGLALDGLTPLGNAIHGIRLDTASNCQIGGTVPGQGNIISGNTNTGLLLVNNVIETVVQGNFIGTDVTGTFAVGNTYKGVYIWNSSGNLIGGSISGARNVISGNGVLANDAGIYIQGAMATDNLIRGNFLGTDITGTVAIPNIQGIQLFDASGCTIGGTASGDGNLISGNSSSGVRLSGANGNTVEGNLIGTDVTGGIALGNYDGVTLASAIRCLVGGASPGSRNVISGNRRHGVLIVSSAATANQIYGNFIGTDITGQFAVPNGMNGLEVASAVGNFIGGSGAEQRNVISGNLGVGVSIHGSTATLNSLINNYIGVDATGSRVLPNHLQGVEIYDEAFENTIGGQGGPVGNVISGNLADGVFIHAAATANKIQGNLIGTDASGWQAVGNGGDGIQLYGLGNEVGTGFSAGNVIAHNGESGVEIDSSGNNVSFNTIFGNAASGVGVIGGQGSTINQNSIFNNGGLGIDLGQDGVTMNPALTLNTQTNDAQRYPEITRAEFTDTGLILEGQIQGSPNTTVGIEIFSNPACDPSGFGEGWSLFMGFDLLTNGSGDGSFALETEVVDLDLDRHFTTTATGPGGSTSEFSPCVLAINSTPSAHEIVVFLLGMIPDPGDLDLNSDGVVNSADVITRLLTNPV